MVGTETQVGQSCAVGQATIVGTEARTWAAKGQSGHYGGQRAGTGKLQESLATMVGTETQVGQSSAVGQATMVGTETQVGQSCAVGQATIVGTEARVGQLQETVDTIVGSAGPVGQ